ncbi:hypothetical protein PYCCODRAFT_1463755 [Trametes coccinea BRFM310]|uniref:Methyltransferase domain-containing protein n=1 Tax=Trametes coccinea (strain BRFM310) TaxID=1353009 RepID=A0A1Y2J2B3_TRAC3|nr:hypothetical protein PYCCODRAFT_1463755 [Trametes coccinea BRFM310]
MIVRPTVSSSFSTRRSQSTPPRRRSNSAGAASAEASPALPASAHLLVQALHPSSKTIPDPLLRSLSGKRKLFRLKRPSGSHSDKSGLHEDHVPPTTPSSSSAVPPRPARNPARLHSYQGPSTADAPDPSPAHDGALSDHPRSDAQEMKPTGDAADWEFPLPRGSEFPLQRKKSKSSKGSAKRAMQDENAKNELLFSTLDRAILEELRQKMRAREDQFVIRSGRKYHAFPAEEVPYPRSYDRQVVDLDVWDNLWQQQLGGSITMHVFKTAPARVLELGCGTGTWILNAAREWKDSLFVGVDVVPLHPDLIQVGSFDLASRITWVQANFLERLPFPNEEFDYVRIVRVARGVPEDKWDGLLEEVTRVMKPGGAFEMWEEDLRFPGSSRETDSVIDAPEPRHVSPPTPPQTDSSHSSEQATPLAVYALPVHRSLAFSYSFDDVLRVKGALLQDDTLRPLRAVPSNSKISSTPMLLRTIERPPINPHDHSLLETIYDEMHAVRFINLEPLSLLTNLLPLHFRDVRAPPPVVINFPPPRVAPSTAGKASMLFAVRHTDPPMGQSSLDGEEQIQTTTGRSSMSVLNGREVAKGSPFIGIDTTRYSGISPAALRRSTLPPVPRSTYSERTSRAQASSLNPDTVPPLHGMNPLPNKTINFDPRALNLILALRVQEVLACAEPMWDWVVDFQETVACSSSTRGRASDHLAFASSRRRRHPKQEALMELTREQFDELLRRFELDMKSRMYLGTALEDRMGWGPCSPSTSEERESYEAMCAAWAEYERRVKAGSNTRSRGFSSSPSPLSRQSNLRTEVPLAHDDNHMLPPLSFDAERAPRRTSEPGHTSVKTAPSNSWPGYAAGPSLSEDSPPPSSRAGRIFVAWKA